MCRNFFLGCFAIIALSALPSFGQDTCNSLLEHGIYDHFVEIGAASSKSSTANEICRAYQQEQSDSAAGKAGGSYGLISGNVSLSSSQIRKLGEQMCSSDKKDSSNRDFSTIDRNLISPAAMKAWQECTHNILLATQTDWHDTDQGTMGVAVSFHLASGGSNNAVNAITTTSNLNCKSPELNSIINVDNPKALPLGPKAYSIDCRRAIRNTPFQAGTREVYSDNARVVIATSVGNIVRDMPAILPPPTRDPIPLGTIVAWYSTHGPVPAGWRLCDGTGGTPDLRDRFIRGIGSFQGVGGKGGSEEVQIPSINLQVGQPDNTKALRTEGSNGVVNHHSTVDYLVDSFTTPIVVPLKGPPSVSLMYIMKQ